MTFTSASYIRNTGNQRFEVITSLAIDSVYMKSIEHQIPLIAIPVILPLFPSPTEKLTSDIKFEIGQLSRQTAFRLVSSFSLLPVFSVVVSF